MSRTPKDFIAEGARGFAWTLGAIVAAGFVGSALWLFGGGGLAAAQDDPSLAIWAALVSFFGSGVLMLSIVVVVQARMMKTLKAAERAAKFVEPKPLSPSEQASAARRINAARPAVKALAELFAVSGDEGGGWVNRFDRLFIETYLAIGRESADKYAWALAQLHKKLRDAVPLNWMMQKMGDYENASSEEAFKTLVGAVGASWRACREWVQTLATVLNAGDDSLDQQRKAFQEWLPDFNKAVEHLAAFNEEARGVGFIEGLGTIKRNAEGKFFTSPSGR